MFKDKKMEEESNAKKENEGQISLQKLIKLDCRDSNFLFKDQFRKQVQIQIELPCQFNLHLPALFHIFSRCFRVHYPHTTTDVSPGEHLLKRFWLHIESHYFKKLQRDQSFRLDYLKSIFSEQIQNPSLLWKDKQFQELLQDVFDGEVLASLTNEEKSSHDLRNLFNRLYIIWKKSQIKLGTKQKKEVQKKLSQSLNTLLKSKNKKKLQKSLQEEEKYLNQLLSSDLINGKNKQSQNQIQKQISKLQKQLQSLCNRNLKTVNKIETFVQNQQNIFTRNDENIQRQNIPRSRKSLQKFRRSQIQTVSQEIHTNVELEEIQFIIKNLEERQLAESMSKILECRKINGDYWYLVAFEYAIHVEPKLFEEKELLKLNKLRQTSLFQFYRTGVKSLYSYTCQSYAGFAQLSQNRQHLGKYKPKDLFEMMKKTPDLTPEQLATFNKFFTCHHCKFLYPDYLLKTCKFSSDRQALPKNNFQATLDPDFSQILCTKGSFTTQSKGRVSQRFTTRKKNCLTGYAKINQEYVCGRKYCFSCLKDCYPNQVMNESIFCPFCQGNCTCSRCLRNQKIVKFKNAFSILGGDLFSLGNQSCIQQLQNKQENLLPKRRGRPKKFNRKIGHIAINRVQKKMRIPKFNGELQLNAVGSNPSKRRITLANKKDKANKRRSILKQKSSTSLLPKRKRGRPPKNSYSCILDSNKLLKNQVDQKQVESIFLSMSK